MSGNDLNHQTELTPGDVVGGDYEVLSLIGTGGMGNVYLVRHQIMQTEYALKTLSAHRVTDKAWKRFQTEAQAIARMNHPNIVGIYNLGIHEGRLPFYVMDILVGKSLQEMLDDKGRLPLKKALANFIDVCSGLAYAHKKGIVHRDIKPPNIVILDRPDAAGSRLKIVDFGIAKLSESDTLPTQQLTRAGEVCGSPYYMSPEQCEGGQVDARSDVYSLGCTIFEALTGSPPFQGRTAVETMMMHQGSKPPTLRAACPAPLDAYGTIDPTATRFPAMLEMVVATMLAKEPGDRYQNIDRLIKDLRTIAQEEFGVDMTTRDTALGTTLSGTGNFNLEKSARAQGKEPTQTNSTIGDGALFLTKADTKNQARKVGPDGEALPGAPFKSALLVFACATTAILLIGGAAGLLIPRTATTPAQDVTTSGAATSTSSSPANSANQLKDFSKVIEKNGEKYVRFDFPQGISLGEIAYQEAGRENKHACEGKFEIKLACQPVLKAGLAFVQHPEYLDRFDANSLYGLEFVSTFVGEDFNDETLAHVGRLKSLTGLGILFCGRASDKALEQVDSLPLLSRLNISDTKMTVVALSKLKRLRSLTRLTLLTEESLNPLLQKLSGSSALNYLDFHRSQLSMQDCKLIASCPNLEMLKLDDCAITDAHIQALSDLRHLGRLSLDKNLLTAASIDNLQKMVTQPPRLLKIRSGSMKPEDEKAFRKLAPYFKLSGEHD